MDLRRFFGLASHRPVLDDPKQKIALTLGFANLSGDEFVRMAEADAAVLGPLFNSVVVVPNRIPTAQVLFVYVRLNENGTIHGSNSAGIRQIVQMTKAPILVVASPNSSESVRNAAALPGPKTANIVFTLERNGTSFPSFFRTLFDHMRDGEDMLTAWVHQAPGGPRHPADAPSAILMAEGGRLAFPKP